MLTTYKHKKLVWVDLESPTMDEVREVMKKYHIDPLIAEELLKPSVKPKVDLYPNFIYLILHFPAFRHTHRGDSNQEVDFIIGKHFLITTRYDTIDPIHKFSKVFEVNSVLDRSDLGDHAGYVFFYMIRKLYKSLEHELEFIGEEIREISERIFEEKEKEMVAEISQVSRELLAFKLALGNHREVLDSFEAAGKRFFGESFGYHLKAVLGEYYRVFNQVEGYLALTTELRETNNAILSTKQNEIMKTLTVMAFIVLPLTFISQLFGMNTHYLPLVGLPGDFWIVIGSMAAVTAAFFVYFKYKKWL